MGPKTGPGRARTWSTGLSRGQARRAWEHRWIAQTPCRLEDPAALGSCLKLLDALEDLDDVRSVTSNLDADEETMKSLAS